MTLTIQEISRKLLHLMALLMPACILYLPREAPFILGLIFFAMISVELIRFRFPFAQGLFERTFVAMLRKEEFRTLTGATWIILSAFLCALLFSGRPHIPFMALSMFILGDSAAAIVGQSVGRVRIGKKTLEGSLACFGTCLFLCYVVFPFLPGVDTKILRFGVIWVSSLVVTLGELIPIRIKGYRLNDNLSVPLMASFAIFLLE